MEQPSSKSFLSRVQGALQDMHPQERRLADLVLNFPGRLAGYSASEIAQLANVSNATVSRFIRKIGYQSFDEARQAVRGEQESGAAFLRLEQAADSSSASVASYLEQSQDNLRVTLSELNPADIDALARAISTAPRVCILGFRSGQPFARYLGWQVSQLPVNVSVLPRDGETLAESLSLIGSEDCVILFALRRVSNITARIHKALAQRGIKVTIIGDAAQGFDAYRQFHCVTAAQGPLFNHVAVMAVCNLLATRVIELADLDGHAHMRDLEKWHSELDQL